MNKEDRAIIRIPESPEAPFEHITEGERVMVFIDGANVYGTTRALEFDINWAKLTTYLQQNTDLRRRYYFTAMKEKGRESSIRPVIDFIDYNGYTVITKPIKEFNGEHGKTFKGNMDAEIVVYMLKMTKWYDHAILFTGDGDFRCLVEAVQDLGCKVTVVSSQKTEPPMIADELRRQADHFVDLTELKTYISMS